MIEPGQVRIFHFRDPLKHMGSVRYPALEGQKFVVECQAPAPNEGLFIVCFFDGERDRINARFIEYHSDLL